MASLPSRRTTFLARPVLVGFAHSTVLLGFLIRSFPIAVALSICVGHWNDCRIRTATGVCTEPRLVSHPNSDSCVFGFSARSHTVRPASASRRRSLEQSSSTTCLSSPSHPGLSPRQLTVVDDTTQRGHASSTPTRTHHRVNRSLSVLERRSSRVRNKPASQCCHLIRVRVALHTLMLMHQRSPLRHDAGLREDNTDEFGPIYLR